MKKHIYLFLLVYFFNIESRSFSPANNSDYLYINLMKKVLTGCIYNDKSVKEETYNEKLREEGKDWPLYAHTMVGLKRLNNVQFCIEKILKNDIPGDLIETGVWRGGTVIFMQAILKVYGIKNRRIWVADSFEGLPAPDAKNYPADSGYNLNKIKYLAIPIEEVKANFEKYGLLEDNVNFLKGWFKDTLPTAPIEKLALLRLDGDLYESTIIALESLYSKVSVGGYIIIDDYNALLPCKKAVDEFRKKHNIKDKIEIIDWTGVYWKKTKM